MQIKITLRFYLTPVIIQTSRTETTTSVGEDVGEKEPSYTAGRNIN
jgi:hypothetical protein